MAYYTHTLPGLGALAWQEATGQILTLSKPSRSRNATNNVPLRFVPGRNDIVLLRPNQNIDHLLKLRVSDDVFRIVARGFGIAPDSRGLRQIHAVVAHSRMIGDALQAWTQANQTRRRPSTFRVVTRQVGRHQFRRHEIGKAVADAVKSAWPGRWQQVDEAADVEIWVNLLEAELLCGLRLSGAEMRQRRGPQSQREDWQHLPAALRPALAAAMVMLTNPDPGDVFLDPMAGTGSLLVERAITPFRQLYGGDNKQEAVAALQANTRTIKGPIQCERWDARKLPLPDQEIDKIAVNLPFGKQIASATDLPALYRAVLSELQRVLRPGGRLVALVEERRVLEAAATSAAPRLRLEAAHRVQVLGHPASINVLVKS